jgi:predicted NAD/FAD-binding protein
MGKQHPVFEPEAVSVFAALAAIDTARASHLLSRALKKHGGHESVGGDIACKDRDTFARVWSQAISDMKEVSS